MKKYIAILAVGAIVSPLMAHAAWYNPLSWFERNIGTTTTVSTIAEPEIATTTEEITPTETPATSTIQTVVKTVVKTDTVTKYIPDPAVVAENTALKAQIATLTAQISALRAQITSNVSGTNTNGDVNVSNPVSITVSQPFCSEISVFDKTLRPRVNVAVGADYDHARIHTKGYKGYLQNNEFVRDESGALNNIDRVFDKKSPYIEFSNLPGEFPLNIEVYQDQGEQKLIGSYTGLVSLGECK